ncbi:MAG: hypothetical protein IIZ39_10540 [Blautia sp.]|nr:hypothetical protein [Blautia sp.]
MPIGPAMELADKKAKYDKQAKILLSYKPVLGKILQLTLPEFKDVPDPSIYIHDGIQVGIVAVDPDVPDLESKDVGYRKLPLGTESNDMESGRIYYDVVFTVDIPGKRKPRKVYVNIEQQVDTDTGYPIVTRGIYYLCRLVSAQKEVEFKGEQYGKIRKCYSIWICPNAKQNLITSYRMEKNDIFGHSKVQKKSYDKLECIVCSFVQGVEENNLLRFLDNLFSSQKSLDERKKVLSEEYGLVLDEEMEGTVREMCNLSDGVYLAGEEKGKSIGADNLAELLNRLYSEGKEEVAKRILKDKTYREQVMGGTVTV